MGLLDGRAALVGAGQPLQELVAALGARGVLVHDLAEETGDVLQACVLGVPDVLAVVVACLERVVLDRDQVVRDVLEAGLTGSHRVPPRVGSGADAPLVPDAGSVKRTTPSRSGTRRLREGAGRDVPAAGVVGLGLSSREELVLAG